MIRTSPLHAIVLATALASLAAFAVGDRHDGHHHNAIGKPGEASAVTRTVEVDMTDDMRFTPARIAVKRGETIRFVVTNSGKLRHEFVLGTEHELKAHYEVMKKFPEMEHDDPNMASVEPDGRGEVVWQFTRAGRVDFACLQPGHYDAGMKGRIAVSTGKATSGDGGPPPAR